MFGDLARNLRLITLRHFAPLSLAGTIVVSLLAAALFEHLRATSDAAGAGGHDDPLGALVLVGAFVGCIAFWTWAWRRLGPGIEQDFEQACRRLNGSLLGEAGRVRLTLALQQVLPREDAGSVQRAFRTRVGGTDLLVAEWSSEGLAATLALAETRLVVVRSGLPTELPAFLLEAETLGTRLAEWTHARFVSASSRRASDDLDFKRDPDWSNRWYLCGPHRPALRALFCRRVRDVVRRARGWRVSGRGTWLVLQSRRAVSSVGIAGKVQEAATLLAGFQRAATAA